jgi:hypothetical protein
MRVIVDLQCLFFCFMSSPRKRERQKESWNDALALSRFSGFEVLIPCVCVLPDKSDEDLTNIRIIRGWRMYLSLLPRPKWPKRTTWNYQRLLRTPPTMNFLRRAGNLNDKFIGKTVNETLWSSSNPRKRQASKLPRLIRINEKEEAFLLRSLNIVDDSFSSFCIRDQFNPSLFMNLQ